MQLWDSWGSWWLLPRRSVYNVHILLARQILERWEHLPCMQLLCHQHLHGHDWKHCVHQLPCQQRYNVDSSKHYLQVQDWLHIIGHGIIAHMLAASYREPLSGPHF